MEELTSLELLQRAQVVKELAVASNYWGGPDKDFYWTQTKKLVKLALDKVIPAE